MGRGTAVHARAEGHLDGGDVVLADRISKRNCYHVAGQETVVESGPELRFLQNHVGTRIVGL